MKPSAHRISAALQRLHRVGQQVAGVGRDLQLDPGRVAGRAGQAGQADGLAGVVGPAGVGQEQHVGRDGVEDVLGCGRVDPAEGDGDDLGARGGDGGGQAGVGGELAGAEEQPGRERAVRDPQLVGRLGGWRFGRCHGSRSLARMTGPVVGGSPPAAASQPGVGSPASRPYATGGEHPQADRRRPGLRAGHPRRLHRPDRRRGPLRRRALTAGPVTRRPGASCSRRRWRTGGAELEADSTSPRVRPSTGAGGDALLGRIGAGRRPVAGVAGLRALQVVVADHVQDLSFAVGEGDGDRGLAPALGQLAAGQPTGVTTSSLGAWD